MEVHAGFSEGVEIGKDAGYSVDGIFGAGDVDSVRTEIDSDMEAIFHEAKVFVAGPVQGAQYQR